MKFDGIKTNHKNKMDGLLLMSHINNSAIATAFFDPQYRGVLDKLNYGNEGEKRGKDRCGLTQMSEDTITTFIKEISRTLKPSGHLFLWIDKFHLCNGSVLNWIKNTGLNVVDMITWEKPSFGMGYRSRRKSEYLMVLQKSPVRAKGCWTDHAIADVWQEKVEKVHTHSKPIELQKRLIAATTKAGDYVLDPASGGYSVFEACKELGIDFIGGDVEYGE